MSTKIAIIGAGDVATNPLDALTVAAVAAMVAAAGLDSPAAPST